MESHAFRLDMPNGRMKARMSLPFIWFLFVGTGFLPAASFRYHLAMDTFAVGLTVPVIGFLRRISPQSHPDSPPQRLG